MPTHLRKSQQIIVKRKPHNKRNPDINWSDWYGDWEGPQIGNFEDQSFSKRNDDAGNPLSLNANTYWDALTRIYSTPQKKIALQSPTHDNPTSYRHDPADIFNRELIDVPGDLLDRLYASRSTITAQQVRDALAQSWPGRAGLKLILEDRSFLTCDYDLFMEALPHLGSKLLNYLTPKTAGYVWVCRMYASLLLVIIAAVLRVDAACKIDDEEGGHSYDGIVLRKSDGSLVFVVIEPQADQVVLHVDPPHHYTGVGFAVFGS